VTPPLIRSSSLMKRHKRLTAGLIVVVLLGLLGWRARHRIRRMFSIAAAQQKLVGLAITPDHSPPQSAAPPVEIDESDWPWWRGAHHDNHATGPLPPLTWSETENILWKTAIPGSGHSSPCLLGNQVFLTTAVEDQKSLLAICLDRDSGATVWSQQIHQGELIHRNLKNSHASSTPATDGQHVFVLFAIDGSIWLSSLTREGKLVWQREVGPYVSKEGFGASPLIADDFVIVAADNVSQSWIAAVHRITGEIAWRVPRGPGTSYASPTLTTDDQDQDLVLIAGLNRVTAMRSQDGSEAWKIDGPDLSASTPVVGDGMLFVTSCTQDSGVFGIRLSDPPETVWKLPLKVEVPSPLYGDGLIYFAQDLGVLMCCESKTGATVWKKRLGSTISASPVLIGDRILVALEDGRTFVLRAGREYEVLAENSVECDGLYATPSISRGQIFLRTVGHLYGIGTGETPLSSKPIRAPAIEPQGAEVAHDSP